MTTACGRSRCGSDSPPDCQSLPQLRFAYPHASHRGALGTDSPEYGGHFRAFCGTPGTAFPTVGPVGPPLPGWPGALPIEGPGSIFRVIARSEATWQSPGTPFVFEQWPRRFPRGYAPRNDRWRGRTGSPGCGITQASPSTEVRGGGGGPAQPGRRGRAANAAKPPHFRRIRPTLSPSTVHTA